MINEILIHIFVNHAKIHKKDITSKHIMPKNTYEKHDIIL